MKPMITLRSITLHEPPDQLAELIVVFSNNRFHNVRFYNQSPKLVAQTLRDMAFRIEKDVVLQEEDRNPSSKL